MSPQRVELSFTFGDYRRVYEMLLMLVLHDEEADGKTCSEISVRTWNVCRGYLFPTKCRFDVLRVGDHVSLDACLNALQPLTVERGKPGHISRLSSWLWNCHQLCDHRRVPSEASVGVALGCALKSYQPVRSIVAARLQHTYGLHLQDR